MKKKMAFVVFGLVIGIVANTSYALMQIQGYTAQKHDRFYVGADKAFIGANYDWSGVGRKMTGVNTQYETEKFVTMISPSYFVSAYHWHPVAGETIAFHEGNVWNTNQHRYIVGAYSYRVPGTDIYIGKLTSPIAASDHVATYPIMNLPSNADYANKEIYLYGNANRVGRNILTGAYYITTMYKYNTTNIYGPSMGADEAYLISGDSGGPSFMTVDNTLALVGTHYSNSGTPAFDGAECQDAYVSGFTNEIANAVFTSSGGAEHVTLVPEPACILVLLTCVLGLKSRRRN